MLRVESGTALCKTYALSVVFLLWPHVRVTSESRNPQTHALHCPFTLALLPGLEGADSEGYSWETMAQVPAPAIATLDSGYRAGLHLCVRSWHLSGRL